MKFFAKSLFLFLILLTPISAAAQTREERVRADKQKVEGDGFWIYNDLDAAVKKSTETGKPILVALRCIPCHECVKLDDDLIDHDPVVQPLLEKFVCVRIVGTNGLDLDTFQYDTDQSFAMFMLNADKTIYGRFGTRSHRTEWVGDVSIDGMARALEGALELHSNYPANQSQLAGKRGSSLEFASPEKFPSLKTKYTDALNYDGDVVKSCIHCHQIGDARREYYWHQAKPIPDDLLFPYPHPKSIGLLLDPKQRAMVKSVVASSPAANAGLREGDSIESLDGQPLLSMADVQWVLHNLDSQGASVAMKVIRDQSIINLTLELKDGWREQDDTSWRVSSWLYAGSFLGGMRLEPLSDEERLEANLSEGMALRIRSLGRYNKHAAARRAGFEVGDILLEYAGQSDLERESDVFAYAARNLKPGDNVVIRFQRSGREQSHKLPLQT
ncbi:MAG: Trx7/PDZ domain-containing (seleno)protein [Rubripirellula sp.]